MLYDEYIGDIRSIKTDEMIGRKIERGKPLHAQGPLGESGGPRKRMEAGQYVPDEEHVHICLGCKKKKCTGFCQLVSGKGKKRKEKEGQEI